jgi:hypothetical protein
MMVLLFLPLVQMMYPIFKTVPLHGFYEKARCPDTLNWSTWTNESFQKKYTKFVEDSFGLRDFLIRTNNQLNYSLFRRTEASKVVVGYHDCLYEENYILDYTGINFMGTAYLDELLRRTKLVQDTLKKIKNIDLIVVYEPGKASFYPEYIPEWYLKHKGPLSNMQYLIKRSKETGMTFLDLHSWFLSLKGKSKYPVYTTYGVHWTTYGMFLAGDTLARYIENIRHEDLPDMVWDDYRVTPNMRDEDFDIEATLNLLFELKHEALCYPEVSYRSGHGKVKPKLLTVGDSYYWGLLGNHIIDSLFSGQEYWYYNQGIWPDIWKPQNIPEVLNLKDEVLKQDVILVMITEMNTYRAFWNFTDQLYELFYPNAPKNMYYKAVKEILQNDWELREHRAKALKQNKSLEEVITGEAMGCVR